MKYFTPLEQFEITVLQPLSLFGLGDFSFTNFSLFLLVIGFFISLFFFLGLHKPKLVPTYWQSIVEMVYLFVLSTVKGQTGKKGIPFFPFIFFLFIFILFSNLIGLLPFGFTVTAQLITTLTLALSINLGLIFMGFFFHGLKFLTLFVPKEAPAALLPLIVLIEVVSYLLRTFSLSVRLFANMMAGHTLLNILSSFIVAFFKTNLWFLGVLTTNSRWLFFTIHQDIEYFVLPAQFETATILQYVRLFDLWDFFIGNLALPALICMFFAITYNNKAVQRDPFKVSNVKVGWGSFPSANGKGKNDDEDKDDKDGIIVKKLKEGVKWIKENPRPAAMMGIGATIVAIVAYICSKG